ncbi:DnaT-like ssDNA-binding domain-containing protein [Pseudomonas sp. SR18]|uniref:DnaT-like ssDNA-binding domain-containing protein n=1 Tax=Pseudomonas sp. SR18 TaxID=1461074 RepID=UPI0020336DFC|nr:DnaT-like ssDNA-binding domain-containing protein [Pseudomonas sp. SR18]MCM2362444.1 DnaT-like ssDNA-binding domain-containing protein [Pseudomonas sp. SR18]
MARARNIKPGLFSNELLVELPAFDRLAFIGLWCLADREGRLEDRVKRIKIELFPCDDYNVEEGLARLAAAGFIFRYQVAGFSVIEIINFQKHQSPHGSEKDSTLPDINGYLTVYERKKNVVVAGSQRKVLVGEQSFNVKEPLEPVNPPFDNALIPDCGILIPDSGIIDSLNQDQHHSLNAGEEIPGSSFEGFDDLEDLPPEEAEPPVDPKTPVEMTLDWMPDANLLKTYCVHFGVSTELFTKDAVAPFTAHHETAGLLQTQSKWVSLLVKWVRDDKNRASNIRPFPKPQAIARHTLTESRDYKAGTKENANGTFRL